MNVFEQIRQLPMPEGAVQYLSLVQAVLTAADEFILTYRDMEPDTSMIASAFLLRLEIDKRRVLFFDNDAMHLPLSQQTTITLGGMMWLCAAKLGVFIYGLDTKHESPRRDALRMFPLATAKAQGLVLYDDEVMGYTLTQVMENLLLVRERWRYLDLEDRSVLNILFLLELRAAFLATHSGNSIYMDSSTYCTEAKNIWVANERFINDMEVFTRVIGRNVVIFENFNVLPVKDLSHHIRIMPLWSKYTIAQWKKTGGVPVPISRLKTCRHWHNFSTHMHNLAVLVTGKNFTYQLKEISTNANLPLPVGEYEADPRSSACLTLLCTLYSATAASRREDMIVDLDLVRTVRDSRIKVECQRESTSIVGRRNSAHTFESRGMRTPEADLTILSLFDAWLSKCYVGWADTFVVTDRFLHIKANHTPLHPYPLLINVLNGWDVLFVNPSNNKPTLWRTREAMVACYTWCYIVWYAFRGEVTLGKTVNLRDMLRTIFGDSNEVEFGAAEAPLDALSNFMNPFFRKIKAEEATAFPGMMTVPKDGDVAIQEYLMDMPTILANIDTLMGDEVVGACRQVKHDRMKLAPIHIQIGEEVQLTCTAPGGSSLLEVEWKCDGKHAEDYKEIVDEIADILQACKDEFIEDALDSYHVSGLVIVQPAIMHPVYRRLVPGVRKWSNTNIALRIDETEYNYRTWDCFSAVAQLKTIPDAVVFDCFGSRPVITNGKAYPNAPVTRIRRHADFVKNMYAAAMAGAINNSVPPMVMQPAPKVAKDTTAAPVNPSYVATGNSVITQQAAMSLNDETNQKRLEEHNLRQVGVAPLVRNVNITTTSGFTHRYSIETSQYTMPEGFVGGPAFPQSHMYSGTDLIKMMEAYQDAVCSNFGTPRRLVFGALDQKTNAGLLQNIIITGLQSFATQLSKILTYAINALLFDKKERRRLRKEMESGETKETTNVSGEAAEEKEEKEDADSNRKRKRDNKETEKMARDDWVHVSFALESYDAENVMQLYGFGAIDYPTARRRLATLAGIKDSAMDDCKDKWDDEHKWMLVAGSLGAKGGLAPKKDEAKAGQKKPKKTEKSHSEKTKVKKTTAATPSEKAALHKEKAKT